jgi:hypothetical protein
VWGREVTQLDLSTERGPSWKPLPVLFTAVFAPLGDAAPDLWAVVVRAATFGAVIAAAALGHRMAGRLGAIAAGGLLIIAPWLWQTSLLGFSEGILIFCVLAAAERVAAGRHGQAFALAVGAALLRPEAWPFLGLYGLWLVVRERRRLPWVAAGFASLPLLWLLPELWGSGSLWRGADRAQDVGPDAPANADRPALQVLDNAIELMPMLGNLGIVAALVLFLVRRPEPARAAPALGVAVLGGTWLLLVMVMTEAGFSGIDRYLYTPVALGLVVGGAGLAWAVQALSTLERPLAVAGIAAVVVVSGLGVWRILDPWPGHLDFVERHGVITDDLDDIVAEVGGREWVKRCGNVTTSYFLRPPMAWELGIHLDEIVRPPRKPGVILRTRLLWWHQWEPRRGLFSDEILARTEHWEAEAACRDPGAS